MIWRERPIRFGEAGHLAGVLTLPATPAPDRPALVLLNAGLLHHVGPARLHVRLARRIAESGLVTLRFDLGGLGESGARRASRGAAEDAIAETLTALDAARHETGISFFLAGGLCSAADHAFRTALRTETIIGLLQLDPWVHATPRFLLRRFGPSLLRPSSWAGVISGRVTAADISASIPGRPSRADPDAVDPTARPFPDRQWLEASHASLLSRGLRLLCVFSGGRWHYCNYEGQLRQAYPRAPFGRQLEEHYMADADHLFSARASQQRVIDLAASWAESFRTARFGDASPIASAV